MYKKITNISLVFLAITLFLSFNGYLYANAVEKELMQTASFMNIKKLRSTDGKKDEKSKDKATERTQAEKQTRSSEQEEREAGERDLKSRAEPPQSAEQQTVSDVTVRKGQVSFNFDDTDVFTVIQTIFGDVLKVNYVIDPAVQGRVNFRTVAPVEKEDVLNLMEVILRLNGIGIVEDRGLYRIIPIGNLAKEPTAVGLGRVSSEIKPTGKALLQVIPLDYIDSSEMVRIIAPFLSENASLVDVAESNHIIIVDTDANVKRIVELVELFDNESLKQTKPQIYVYAVQNSNAIDLANILAQIFLENISTKSITPARTKTYTTAKAGEKTVRERTVKSQPSYIAQQDGGLVSPFTKIIPDEITNSIIILASPEDYALISETIRKIDILPRQVLIEALIARVDLTDDLSFGIQWKIKNDIEIEPFTNPIDLSGDLDLVAPIENANFTYTALDAAGNIKLLLQSLAEEGKAEVMAAPHILVSDNREARIQVGQQVPIPTSETNVEGTTSIQRTFQYKDLGIILEVKPQVNESGLVALELQQEVSSSTISDVAIAAGATPVLNKTETSTNLVARDGETIIIGGLIREDATKSSAGIPFLHKIPILGYLFGSKTRDIARTELLILLTPHVMQSQEEASDVTSEYIKQFKSDTDIDPEKDKRMLKKNQDMLDTDSIKKDTP
jgi:general secretion pathway protein D